MEISVTIRFPLPRDSNAVVGKLEVRARQLHLWHVTALRTFASMWACSGFTPVEYLCRPKAVKFPCAACACALGFFPWVARHRFLELRARLGVSGYVPNIARKNEHSMVFFNSCAPCLSPCRYSCDPACSGHVRTGIRVSRTDSADGMEQLEQIWMQRKRQTHSRNRRRRGQQWHAGGRLSVCEHR